MYSEKTDASEISPAGGQKLYSGGEVTKRTDGSGLDHVADGETLDCLILGGASRAVAAANGLDVAAALLVATAVKC